MHPSTTDDADYSGHSSSGAQSTSPNSELQTNMELLEDFVPQNGATGNSSIITPSMDDSQSNTSITILAVVAVVAILTLLVFAVITFRYLFVHKGTYKVKEFKSDLKLRDRGDHTKVNNIYDVETTKEWLL